MMAWTENDVRKLLSDPNYCLGANRAISEELWIKAAVRSINEDGAETFLRNLLENLKKK
jgi:hypothetical protein